MSTSDRSQSAGRGAAAGELAYHWVKDRILDGTLEGGQLISEGEVAASVLVSRTPVREAFLRLEVEGLLRLYPKRGALVVPVSAGEVADVTEARVLLENHAVDKIIASGRHGEVADRMAALLLEQRSLDMPARGDRFSALDREFHATLIDAAGNALVAQFYSGLRDRQLRMGNSALHRAPGRHHKILAQHEEICRLLRLGDAENLHKVLVEHISGTHGALLDT